MSYHNRWGNWSMVGCDHRLWLMMPSWTYQGILSIKTLFIVQSKNRYFIQNLWNSDLNMAMNDKCIPLLYMWHRGHYLKLWHIYTVCFLVQMYFKFFSNSLTEPHKIFNGKWSVRKYFKKSFICFATICNLLFKAFYLSQCKTPMNCYVNLLTNWYMYVTYLCK